MNFTKYVDHVAHGNELRSIVRNGLIPVGFSTQTRSYAVFFTLVDPMNVEQGLRETFCDLSQARIAPYKNTWKHLRNTGFRETFCDLSQARIAPYKNTWKRFRNTVHWCNLLPARERGMRFYQTRSNAVVLYDTLPAEFIEKAVCMKTGEQLYQRESGKPVS